MRIRAADQGDVVRGLLDGIDIGLLEVLANAHQRFIEGDREDVAAESLDALPHGTLFGESDLAGLAPFFDRADFHGELDFPLPHLGEPGTQFFIFELLVEIEIGVEEEVDQLAGFLPLVGMFEERPQCLAVFDARRGDPDCYGRTRSGGGRLGNLLSEAFDGNHQQNEFDHF